MIRAWLARLIGPTPEYTELLAAFKEGYKMAIQIDPLQCHKKKIDPVSVKKQLPEVQTWRNVHEAWLNSDTAREAHK